METFLDFLDWAWERHHNPLSWYVRPVFLLPYCYFAYKRSLPGLLLTIVALATSMFWFPEPDEIDQRARDFLAMERQYISGSWTLVKVAMTALIPIWFIALAWAFWRRSWVAGFVVINGGTLLKVLWSFYFSPEAAWSIVPAVSIGLVLCNGTLYWAYRRLHLSAKIRG